MQISTMRIDELDKLHIKKIGEKKLPEFSPGDTLKVNVRIIEGKRQRIQAYEGVCIAKKNKGILRNVSLTGKSNAASKAAVVPMSSDDEMDNDSD